MRALSFICAFFCAEFLCLSAAIGAEPPTNEENVSPINLHITYTHKDDMLHISADKGWGYRNSNSISMFMRAFNIIREGITFDFSLDICTDDGAYTDDVLAYANREGKNAVLIPDFVFAGWPECGIDNYDETCKQIAEAGAKPYIYNKIFWIGNSSTNRIREELMIKGDTNNNFEFISMNWTGYEKREDRVSRLRATKYVSLPDHTQYKYLIDVPGYGYSARVKLLMFSNRPLFYVARAEEEFYMKDLKPYVHYIPVKADLSDLEEQYQWAEEHPQEAKQIAANALEYAQKNLTSKAAIIKYATILENYLYYNKKPKETSH